MLLAIWLGFGFWTAILALCLYAILPVLRNTIVGLQGVDPTLVEAGRGMGMSSVAVLGRVELPLAVPVIMAGIRTALVLVVGTATLATFINAGGLGSLITAGISSAAVPGADQRRRTRCRSRAADRLGGPSRSKRSPDRGGSR